MKHTEKDLVINKIREMPEEQVSKVLIFIAGLEAGIQLQEKKSVEEGSAGEF